MAFKKISVNTPPKKTACQSGCCSPTPEPSAELEAAATCSCCPPVSPATAAGPSCSCCSQEPPAQSLSEPTCACCTDTSAIPAPAPACDCCADISTQQVRSQITAAAAPTRTSTFTVDGLDCADCAAKLEKGIGKLTGVTDAKVNLPPPR